MLGLTLFFIIYLGYSFFFRKLLKIEFSHALVFSTCIILSIYFLAAIFYFLDPIIYSSFAIGVGLFGYIIFDFLKHNKIKNIGELFTWDVVAFILIVSIYFISIKNLPTYFIWGDYSLWGILIKEMNIYHGLRSPEAPTAVLSYMKNYVQLPTIFYYSISKLIGFKEAYNIFANGLLYIIFSSVALVERSRLMAILLTLVLVLPSTCDPVSAINSLYVDTTVAFVFGAAVAIYIQSQQYNKPLLTLVLIAPLLFILPNIKEVGYWFSYIIILIIFIDAIYIKNYRNLLWAPILILLPILSKFIWSIYLQNIGISYYHTFLQIPFVSIYNILFKVKVEQIDLIKSIIKHIAPYFSSCIMLYTYIIIISTVVFLWQNQSHKLKEFIKLLIILCIGFFLYAIFRVEIYLNYFSKEEAQIAASHNRYFASYTFIFWFASISFVKTSLNTDQLKLKNLLLFYCISLILGIISLKHIIYQLTGFIYATGQVSDRLARQDKIQDLIRTGLNDNLNFKENNFQQFDCYIYNYLLAPNTGKDRLDKCLIERTDR
jgi:hypothetical protein